MLGEYVRFALAPTITTLVLGEHQRIKAITLEHELENVLASEKDGSRAGTLSPDDFAYVIQQLREYRNRLQAEGRTPVVVTRPDVRAYLRRLLEGPLQDLMILSYSELSINVELESISRIGLPKKKQAA